MLSTSITFILFFLFYLAFAIAGMGAAIIAVPFLTLLNFDINLAKAVALSCNSFSTFPNAAKTVKSVKKELIIVIISILLGTILAVKSAFTLNKKIVLISSAIIIYFVLFLKIYKDKIFKKEIKLKKQSLALIISSFFISFISTLAGIGGGAFYIPVFSLILNDDKKAVNLASNVIFLSTLTGSYKYTVNGHFWQTNSHTFIKFWILAAIAGIVGSFLKDKIQPKKFKIVLNTLIFIAATLLLVKGFLIK